MQRRPDWPDRLAGHIDARRRMPFAWGKDANDCCSAALGWVREATGVDVMADVADYDSALGAARVLATISIVEFCDAHFERRRRAFLQRGDLALVEINGRHALTIVDGDTLAGPGSAGLMRLPRSAAQMGWAV